MLLAIDAGNTNIVFALYEGEKMRAQWRAVTQVSAHRRRICRLAEPACWRWRNCPSPISTGRSSPPWCRRCCSTCAPSAATI